MPRFEKNANEKRKLLKGQNQDKENKKKLIKHAAIKTHRLLLTCSFGNYPKNVPLFRSVYFLQTT